MKQNKKALFGIISSMLIFGTIGVFRQYTNLPSGLLSATRGLIGAAFLLLAMVASKEKFSRGGIGKSLPLLVLSGAMIGVNWILFFEAFNYTTIPVATLCYYLAPIFIILASPMVLGEKLTRAKLCCSLVAFAGIALVAFGSNSGSTEAKNHLIGMLLGIGAAMLYAGDILINKVIEGVAPKERTLVQLAVAGIVCVPYTLLVEDMSAVTFDARAIIMILIMGVFHTGFAYTLYFGSIKQLKASTVALLSYIDPVTSVILAVLLIKGSVLSPLGWLGAALVLGAAAISELKAK